MEIVSTNHLVFSEVERMCRELYGSNHEYDDAVIVLGYNVAEFTPADLRERYPGSRIIAYQLEQLFETSKWATDRNGRWLRDCDEVWEYDLNNLAWTESKHIVSKYRPMSYCKCLADIPKREKDIDVLFYGYPTPRRQEILSRWMGGPCWDKYSTIDATGVTGELLKELISRSKVILNIHAFIENCRQEQVRMFYPVINGSCVVSERSPANEFGKAIVETDTARIPAVLRAILASGDWKKIGDAAPETYRKHCEDRKS